MFRPPGAVLQRGTLMIGAEHAELFGFLSDFFLSTLRMATPLIFAAMGGVLCERSGVVNIALEGQMLVGALMAALVAHQVQVQVVASGAGQGFLSIGAGWLGWWAGGLAGLIMALVLSFLSITCKSQQIITGTGLNMLAMGLCPTIAFGVYGVSGSTPTLEALSRLAWEPTAMALGLPVVFAAFLRWTKGGLWLTVAGENPSVLLASGLSAVKVRYGAVLVSGLLAGWGGASLSLALSSSYSRDMTAGRGYIALAAVVLGKWHPLGAMGACFLFGAAEAMQMRMQTPETLPPVFRMVSGAMAWPPSLIQILPYGAALVVLAFGVGRMRPPQGLGR